MKVIGFKEITGKIILKSGLHIGAGDTEMRIGGTDNPVVKHPHRNEPYIPGSSLKGKVRSLLELRSGFMILSDGSPLGIKELKKLTGTEKEEGQKILKLFGTSGADDLEEEDLGPTRVSFADAPLNDLWKQRTIEKGMPYTEVKAENTIDRIKGTASNPRFIERVAADAEFDFNISVKQFEGDEKLEEYLFEGIKLLEMDSLGGSGSRGYGRVRFEFDDKEINEKFKNINLF